MILFFVLLGLLILFLIFAIIYPIEKRKILSNKFNKYCDKKINKICLKKSYFKITNFNLNINRKINQIILGNKYIYLISNFPLFGLISGDKKNNSWLYSKSGEKQNVYLDNLTFQGNKVIQEFASIFNINESVIVNVSLIPNECEIQVKDVNNPNNFIIHYGSIKRFLRIYENRKITPLNKDQLERYFNIISDYIYE